MSSLIASFFLIAVAEMGDKTQLLALSLATKYTATKVLIGITLATLVVHLFSAVLGQFVGSLIPMLYLQVIVGASFIFFGLWTLRGDSLEDKKSRFAFGAIMTVAIAFFIAELGDKTQLATISLAAQYKSFWGVWMGSTLGMVAADAVAVGIGVAAHKKLPETTIKYSSAAIFIIFGFIILAQAFM